MRCGPAARCSRSAAIEASEGSPQTLSFVTLDDLLAESAAKEGFPVLTPGVR